MHYFIGVVIPFKYEGAKLDEALGEILAPWDESNADNPNGQWDWWSLGGRWNGVWSDEDPASDPVNQEVNPFGAGMRPKWPTQWRRREDLDVIPVARLLDDESLRRPYAIVAAPNLWCAEEKWDGNDFVKHPDYEGALRIELEKRRECWIAVVDIHS